MASDKPQASLSPAAFGLAIQALAYLAATDGICPSQQISQNMKFGTTLTRRMMAPLVKAQLAAAREGRDGGYRLAKPAEQITVADVYRALQIQDPLTAGLLDSTTECPGGQAVRAVFEAMAEQAERSKLEIYARYTIADIAALTAAERQ